MARFQLLWFDMKLGNLPVDMLSSAALFSEEKTEVSALNKARKELAKDYGFITLIRCYDCAKWVMCRDRKPDILFKRSDCQHFAWHTPKLYCDHCHVMEIEGQTPDGQRLCRVCYYNTYGWYPESRPSS